ncbi:MAG: glutamyl-tRNA reductase [Desulfovibrionaceae bacterium]|nr:glutamyl-tRNA reductase [Desulfovibrionaceae bacterium]
MEEQIYLVGMNYRTAAVNIRERFALTACCDEETWAIPLRNDQDDYGISEALILSTCNRVEILAVGSGSVPDIIFSKWSQARQESCEELRSHAYIHTGKDAVRHLFRVASSLDSMVLGEPQILGQLKAAYRKAATAHKTGSVINRLLHRAFSVAKRVRTETAVAANAVSISYAAVELAKRIFGNLNGHEAMLLGAGEMAELAATHLLQAGISRLYVANRTFARAQELAERFHGQAIPFDQFPEQFIHADIVIGSTGSTDPVVTAIDVRKALPKRKQRPMFFIDIAVPRDIAPEVNNLDNVYLYDIDDLRETVEENLAHRREEAEKASQIIEEETEAFELWQHSLSIQPTIVELIQHFQRHANEEFQKTMKRIGPADEQVKEALEVMLHSLVRKFSHELITFLKEGESAEDERVQLIRRLFDLDRDPQVRISRRHHDEEKTI